MAHHQTGFEKFLRNIARRQRSFHFSMSAQAALNVSVRRLCHHYCQNSGGICTLVVKRDSLRLPKFGPCVSIGNRANL
jgi:hypothetical protein